jgi:hypothetical protein
MAAMRSLWIGSEGCSVVYMMKDPSYSSAAMRTRSELVTSQLHPSVGMYMVLDSYFCHR